MSRSPSTRHVRPVRRLAPIAVVLAVLLAVLLAACGAAGDGGDDGPDPPVVTLQPFDAEIEVGETVTVRATTASPTDAPYAWGNSRPDVAALREVERSDTGAVAELEGSSPGTTVVSYGARADGSPPPAEATLTVVAAGEALTVSGTPVPTAVEDEPYEGFTVEASGGEPPYTFALVGTWPAGLTIDPASGAVSGTPTEFGTFANLTVQATDAEDDTAALAPFTVEVLAALPDLSLESPSAWWNTTPEAPLAEFGTVRMELTFVNESAIPIDFDGDSLGDPPEEEVQMWTTPSVSEPPFTVEAWPEGSYATGESFDWIIVVDVSAFAATETGFALRPNSPNRGTVTPDVASLTAQVVTVER